jgi:hypothetical protein
MSGYWHMTANIRSGVGWIDSIGTNMIAQYMRYGKSDSLHMGTAGQSANGHKVHSRTDESSDICQPRK